MAEAIASNQVSELDLERLKISDTTPQTNTGKGNNAPVEEKTEKSGRSWKESEEKAGVESNNAPIPNIEEDTTERDLGPHVIGIIMDEYRPMTEEEIREAKREEEKRKKVLDANNIGDPEDIAGVEESAVYPTIATEFPGMKCCQVRWHYVTSKEKKMIYIPLKGKDSQLVEIRHRLLNGIELDDEAQCIYKEHLENKFKFETALDSRDGKVRLTEQRSTDTEDESDSPKHLVLNGLYKVSRKNSRIHAVYWKEEPMKLVRGTYFKLNGQPIEEKLAKDIERHLDRFWDEKWRMEQSVNHVESEKLSVPSPLHTHDNLIEWTFLFELTIQSPNQNPTSLVSYPELANWTDDYPKIEHLVFVVHGVGHNGKQHSVVDTAKLLTEGVDNAVKKSSGILFLPIHWRSLIETEPPCPCKNDLVKDFNPVIKHLLPDVDLYNCLYHGPKIRQTVIERIRNVFKKFKENNPDFTGTVSLFGHSLGSVICYDILTMKSLKSERKSLGFKVDKLFTVGSPLKKFLKKRGGPSRQEFQQAICLIRIYNVFHPHDVVARRLEPFASEMYRMADPLEILTRDELVPPPNRSYIVLKSVASAVWNPMRWTWMNCSEALMRNRRRLRQELPYRIDYQLQKHDRWDELQTHSIYSSHVGLASFMVSTLRNLASGVVLTRKNSAESENGEENDSNNNHTIYVWMLKTNPRCRKRKNTILAIRQRRLLILAETQNVCHNKDVVRVGMDLNLKQKNPRCRNNFLIKLKSIQKQSVAPQIEVGVT